MDAPSDVKIIRMSGKTNVADSTQKCQDYLASIGHVGYVIGRAEVWSAKRGRKVIAVAGSRDEVLRKVYNQ